MSGAAVLLPCVAEDFFVLLQVVFSRDMMLALLADQLYILLGGNYRI